ncbi:hypothetical protein GSI_14356 [Ganoderma sinense ZZ0214-1]|uniref:Uncharacterized protein n=1 Tax=Ganoderma sinense ZZ0214-1 TaxID=1077348 RepID=A0A2G8RNF5_9APHY|nr:hypothetical protein GSI_14356 [Ganoderma sinense ZZ0214-1]
MNPSAQSSVYTATDARSYTSSVFRSDSTQSYYPFVDYAPNLYEDPSSSAVDWSGECVRYSDSDRALFETFLAAEVTSTTPSRPNTLIPTQSRPSYHPETRFIHRPTDATQPHSQSLDGFRSYPYASASYKSTIPTASELSLHEVTSSPIPSDLMYPPLYDADTLEDCPSAAPMAQPSRLDHPATHCYSSSNLYLFPFPELSPQTSLIGVASQQQNAPAHTGNPAISFAFEPSLPEAIVSSIPSYPYATASSQSTVSPAFERAPPETTAPCISPDLIHPSAHCVCDLEDDNSANATSQFSRSNYRAAHRGSSSSPYPTPSPEPSPRTSSVIIASQRRNAPARTTVPASNAWQCPHCPYVQRNRRSPDLKRHIKTHTRGDDVADWVCCGVPVLSAIELGVPDRILREGQVFVFDGVLMVGGCRKAFSRRDALHRHLQRERGKCFGDALSLHQRGNRESC